MTPLNIKYEYRLIAFLGVLSMLIASCGYRFAGQGNLPDGARNLGVTVFANRTAETGVENIVTRCLIAEFVSRGVKVGGGSKGADVVLSGSVESLRIHTISRSGQQTALERRVNLSVDAKLAGIDGTIIWSVKGLTDSEAYDVEQDKPATEQNRSGAIERLSRRLAEVVYARVTEDF